MSAEILHFKQSGKVPDLEERAYLARVTQAFARRVDYNIRWVSARGYEYISRVLLAVFRSIIASQGRYTDGDTYQRSDYEITNCSIFECARIIHEVDAYLEKIHVQESPEKEFFMHIRNIAFQRKNFLANAGREK